MHKNTGAQIIYLYCITCNINNKNYIGQTVDPTSRWRGHRRDSADPKVPLQFAIKKHGASNFQFEIIATCKGQDNANELETELVAQYDSFVNNNKGYNATHGGMNAPKSEQWKQAMRNWHASLSLEERAEISRKQAEATINQIATQGHPAQGKTRTDEQKAKMSAIQRSKDNDAIYTEEVRRRFSEAHIGIKDSEETKLKKSSKAALAWEKRQATMLSSGELKCNAPECNVSGKITGKYYLVNNIRYCSKHAQRLKRTGSL